MLPLEWVCCAVLRCVLQEKMEHQHAAGILQKLPPLLDDEQPKVAIPHKDRPQQDQSTLSELPDEAVEHDEL
jgi:hypothetical protein